MSVEAILFSLSPAGHYGRPLPQRREVTLLDQNFSKTPFTSIQAVLFRERAFPLEGIEIVACNGEDKGAA